MTAAAFQQPMLCTKGTYANYYNVMLFLINTTSTNHSYHIQSSKLGWFLMEHVTGQRLGRAKQYNVPYSVFPRLSLSWMIMKHEVCHLPISPTHSVVERAARVVGIHEVIHGNCRHARLVTRSSSPTDVPSTNSCSCVIYSCIKSNTCTY